MSRRGWTVKWSAPQAGDGWLAWRWKTGWDGTGGGAYLTGEPLEVVRVLRMWSLPSSTRALTDLSDRGASLLLALDLLARAGVDGVVVD